MKRVPLLRKGMLQTEAMSADTACQAAVSKQAAGTRIGINDLRSIAKTRQALAKPGPQSNTDKLDAIAAKLAAS